MTNLNDSTEPGTSAQRLAFDVPLDGRDTSGVVPVVQMRINASDEAGAAARWLLDQRSGGLAWRDMVVVAPGKRNWRDPIAKALQREAIPFRMLLGDKSIGPDPGGDHVHVMTLHAIEEHGYPASPAVAVLGIGDLPWKTQTLDKAAHLLDVATTRATHALMISHSKPSTLVERLLSS